jgi:hypothetical protein
VRQHAADDTECRRFAGAIGADQSEDFPIAKLETDLIESFESAVAFGERVCFDDWLDRHH